MHTHVVFCEFEAAVAERDTTLAMLELFAPPSSRAMIDRIRAGSISEGEGARRVLAQVPTERFEEILQWAREITLRDGLAELVDFLEEHESPLVVYSDGLRAVVDAALGPLAPHIEHVYGLEVELSGPHLEVRSEIESPTSLVDRAAILQRHPAAEAIAIAALERETDIADSAQVVLARGALAEQLNENAVPYEPFRTFHDVRRHLDRLWPAR